MTNELTPSVEVLPSLGLLSHRIRVVPAGVAALAVDTPIDAVFVDARRDLAQARTLCGLLDTVVGGCPVIVVVTEGGLAALTAQWHITDVLVTSAGPAEVEARLRLAIGRRGTSESDPGGPIAAGELVIDESTYSARLRGRLLDLTYKEFELLKHLAQHPGRVFTRAQLVQDVWGYDYFGGTRTVDVHVRRLRAKLGADHENLIGTVRNVGYRFVPEADHQSATTPSIVADKPAGSAPTGGAGPSGHRQHVAGDGYPVPGDSA